jgi:hypothetical protein
MPPTKKRPSAVVKSPSAKKTALGATAAETEIEDDSDDHSDPEDDNSDSFDTGHNTKDLTSFFSALVDHASYSRMLMASKLNVTRLSTMLRVCPSPA